MTWLPSSCHLRILSLAALLLAPGGSETADPVVLESEHYRLTAWPPFAEGEEYLRLAEALHGKLKEHFEAEPPKGKKLEVLFWPDAASFRKGGLADGVAEGALTAGGVYWTGTRKAYFWRQPSANFTRHLFLHELTHQFHYLAVMDNQARTPPWYSEGLAEHFGYHRWDGTALEPGVDDVLGLEQDIPDMAAEAKAGTFDVVAVVEGKRGGDKPPSWAAVHWLLSSPDPKVRARFLAAERKMWRGLKGKPLVEAVLGPDLKGAREACNRWLTGLRTTWRIEWISWDARGSTIVGESGVVALVRTREEPAGAPFVEATVRSPASAGILLAFRTTDDFLAIYRRPGGRIEVIRRRAGGWQNLAAADGPGGDGVLVRAEVLDGKTVRVLVGGTEVIRCEPGGEPARGSVGLFVDGGRGEFDDVKLPPSTSGE
jgi:hypothetical protein